MFRRKTMLVLLLLMVSGLVACKSNGASNSPDASGADLGAIKQYALDNGSKMKEGTAALHTTAQAYYDFLAEYNFDYAAAWAADSAQLISLTSQAKSNWNLASQYYELDEGIVAGVPSLAHYDVWIDAGASAEEDPEEAYEWTLELPNGTTLESPGNFFHSLLEPTIWGTIPQFTGQQVDLNGDGNIVIGEALPEANLFLAAAAGLDSATAEMIASIEAWTPTNSDAFTALVVMVPTMNEYFEQWKLSTYVSGDAAEETAFIGVSRLVDINGILTGLDFTYENVAVLVEAEDEALHQQIVAGFDDLRGYVTDLLAQEQAGTIFTADQVDLFGTEAQNKASALAGQVSQAAALLSIEIVE